MSKELFVCSTPHQTKVALVENDQLAEVYFERENEYTLAGSIYKGRVTRVLPGMQSAFVDIGLERDAFLYVSDFFEMEDEDEAIEPIPVAKPYEVKPSVPRSEPVVFNGGAAASDDVAEDESEAVATEPTNGNAKPAEGEGGRRWRGRRRRGRGRGGRGFPESKFDRPEDGEPAPVSTDSEEEPLEEAPEKAYKPIILPG